MANKVEMAFEPKEARLIQAFLKINQAYDQTKNKARQFNQETKKSQSSFSQLGQSITSQIGSMAAGFVSISTLLSEARRAWSAWNDEIERTGNTLAEFTNNLKAATTGRGDPYNVVRPELLSIAGETGLNRQEIQDLYGAVGGALPFGASTTQVLSLVREAAGAKRAFGPEQMPLIGAIAGNLFKTVMQPEQFTPEQQANVAAAMVANLGAMAPRAARPGFLKGLGALEQMGVTGVEAASFATAAAFTGQGGELFERMAMMATQREAMRLPAPALGEVESPERRRERVVRDKYASMSRDDFVRNVVKDQEAMGIFFKGAGFKVEEFGQALQRLGPTLQNAMDRDIIDSQWEQLVAQPGEEVERAWEVERLRSQRSLLPLGGGRGALLSEARNIFVERETNRLESLVQRGMLSPALRDRELQSLKAGLALGLWDEEIYAIAGLEQRAPEFGEAGRRLERQGGTIGLGPGAMGMVPVQIDPRASQEMERFADNAKAANDEIDRSKDEAKAVDIGDRE